jgi:hypothetical protein
MINMEMQIAIRNISWITEMKLKKLIIILTLLAMSSVSFTANIVTGEVAAEIGQILSLTPASYPTNITTGTPVEISDGTGCTDVVVVKDMIVNDNSKTGWTLFITQTNGNLLHTVDSTPIAYSISFIYADATYTQLDLTYGYWYSWSGLDPLYFDGLQSYFRLRGDSVDDYKLGLETIDYTFDLLMTITDAATVGKLPGDYVETLSFVLTSMD